MGGGNGQKAKMAREKHMERNRPAKGSQLETNKKAMNIQFNGYVSYYLEFTYNFRNDPSVCLPFVQLLVDTAKVRIFHARHCQGNALHALRSRFKDPTNVLQSWDPTLVNPCTWFHVTCDSNNHVIRLDLGNSNISGTLGPELGQLQHLQYLELYMNDISGKIPKELGNLKSLVSMDMYQNKLEGEIPKSFANLKSLKFLRLNNNKLTGSIPRELTTLSDLKVFDVSNNGLCGTIPVDGPFRSFPMESFENNKLNGPELQGLVPYDFGC
ncbi:hypothetical protein WN944_028675 [Citrus x changshan-huyou]|uniref:Leucine-rich repeat-containing N-terminal plant-type domain-containing protein n=1 Tax=Citrus x changshan-huyou TaxID=2935761 RepID=A0AAP0LKA8_9ROSI